MNLLRPAKLFLSISAVLVVTSIVLLVVPGPKISIDFTGGTLVEVQMPEGKTKEEIISNAIEVKSRGAYIVGVSPENNEVFDYWIKVPEVDEVASSLVNLIPMQLLSYYLGKFRGHDVDCPRSLAKSVTVK